MGIFGSSKKKRLGIDIGTAALKFVELTEESNRFILSNYGSFELDQETGGDQKLGSSVKSNYSLSDKDIVWGMKEMIKRANITTKNVVASIPSFPTFATTLTLPYLSEEEIAKTVPFEARKYIPVPLNEVKLKWAIIGVNKQNKAPSASQQGVSKPSAPSVEVLFIAVPNEEIRRYESIMSAVGLSLIDLELENFALIRSILGNDRSPMAIVNIGGRGSSIVIVDNGYQRLNRDYEIGSFAITKAISKSLNINLKRAEELKRSIGVTPGDQNIIRTAIVSLLDLIAFETKKTIHNYEDTKKVKVSKITMVGGMSKMPGLVDYFKEKIGANVGLGNSMARVVLPDGLKPLQADLSATFAVAVGLAMKEVKK